MYTLCFWLRFPGSQPLPHPFVFGSGSWDLFTLTASFQLVSLLAPKFQTRQILVVDQVAGEWSENLVKTAWLMKSRRQLFPYWLWPFYQLFSFFKRTQTLSDFFILSSLAPTSLNSLTNILAFSLLPRIHICRY